MKKRYALSGMATSMVLIACALPSNKTTEMAMPGAQRLFEIMKRVEDKQEIITPESLSKLLPIIVNHVPDVLADPFHEVTPVVGQWLDVEGVYVYYRQRGVLGNVKAFSAGVGGVNKLGCFQLRRQDLDHVLGKNTWLQAPPPAHITVSSFPDGADGEIRRNTIEYSFGGLSLGSKKSHGMSFIFDEKGCLANLSLSNW